MTWDVPTDTSTGPPMYIPSTDTRSLSPGRVNRQGGLEGWYRRGGVGLTRCDDSIASTRQTLMAVGKMLGRLPCWIASGPSSLQRMAQSALFMFQAPHTLCLHSRLVHTNTPYLFSTHRSWDILQAPLCFATFTVNTYLGIYSSYHPCLQPFRRPLTPFSPPSTVRFFYPVQ